MKPLAALREAFPVTFAGWALLGLAGAAFWFQGVGRLDLVLLAASVLAAVLVAGLGLATLAAALVLRRRAGGGPGSLALECGTWSPTGYRVPLSRWLPFLRVRVAWEAPGDLRADLRLPSGQEHVLPGRRALVPSVTRTVRVGDILGLTETGWRAQAPTPARILPRRAALDPGAVLSGLVRGEDQTDPRGEPQGDRVDIRKYGHGDPLRMILWKVYARTRKAFVRIPERAVEPAPRVCAYLPAHPWDEPPARLARTLLERGLLGPGWRFGADGAEDAEDLEGAREALARSGSSGGAGGFAAFLERARRDGFGACILLLPGRDGPWTAPVQAALATAPLRVQAVFALDGWREPAPSPWRRAFLRPEPEDGAAPEEVLDLLGRIAAPPTGATLVDIRSGDVLDHPEAYLRKRAGRAA
ncbi:DUF58 domain-containing protein [Mesoterricola silvestris]|uniref:DUF58 domain-containing protein n=1 Tax=Mesoterricola silvestris TaxID=2927979 RepID=A0AA48GJ59_9BACT|nr:DUF58 domain-containing protein [Mesoterricola silvestris]BDU73961.1 hypothetical protein METEAL_31350 [Mesoterricola silvestris]